MTGDLIQIMKGAPGLQGQNGRSAFGRGLGAPLLYPKNGEKGIMLDRRPLSIICSFTMFHFCLDFHAAECVSSHNHWPDGSIEPSTMPLVALLLC